MHLDFYAKTWCQSCSSGCSAERGDFEEDADFSWVGYVVLACFLLSIFAYCTTFDVMRGRTAFRMVFVSAWSVDVPINQIARQAIVRDIITDAACQSSAVP